MIMAKDRTLERWDGDGAGRVVGTCGENLVAHLALLLALAILISFVFLRFRFHRVRMSKDTTMVSLIQMPSLLDLLHGYVEILRQLVVKLSAAGHQTVFEMTDQLLHAFQVVSSVDALGGKVFALEKSLVGVVEETFDLMVVEGLWVRLNVLICDLHVSNSEVKHAQNNVMTSLVRRIDVLLQIALSIGRFRQSVLEEGHSEGWVHIVVRCVHKVLLGGNNTAY